MRKSRAKFTYQTDMKPQKQKDGSVWYHIDSQGRLLGRVASEATRILMGKHKTDYTPNIDSGDHLVITNIKNIRLTGKKMTNKIYTSYSGYPGGLKRITAGKVYKKDPCDLVRRAVKGMLPDNKLKKKRMKRLHLFAEKHTLDSSITLIPYEISKK